MSTIPAGALVLLVGPSGAGKDTWASRHAPPGSVVSSDTIRAQLFGDERDQRHPGAVFDVVDRMVAARLSAGLTTVVNATNLISEHRDGLVSLASRRGATCFAVRFAHPLQVLLERNSRRAVPRPERVVRRHHSQFGSCSATALSRQGLTVLEHDQQVSFAPFGIDVSWFTQPVAVVSDHHGCSEGMAYQLELIERAHPGIHVISLGDLADRGPDAPGCYEQLLARQRAGTATLIASNHGNNVVTKVGPLLDRGMDASEIAQTLQERADKDRRQFATAQMAKTVAQFAARADGEPLLAAAVQAEAAAPAQMLLHGGKLALVHGGILPGQIGDPSSDARQVNLYGTPLGRGPNGMPEGRDSWVEGYLDAAATAELPLVVYGHVAYDRPRVTARTIGIDTGAGKDPDAALTAVVIDDGAVVDVICSPSRTDLCTAA